MVCKLTQVSKAQSQLSKQNQNTDVLQNMLLILKSMDQILSQINSIKSSVDGNMARLDTIHQKMNDLVKSQQFLATSMALVLNIETVTMILDQNCVMTSHK